MWIATEVTLRILDSFIAISQFLCVCVFSYSITCWTSGLPQVFTSSCLEKTGNAKQKRAVELLVLSNRISCLQSTFPVSKHCRLCIKISPCPCAVRQGPWQDTDVSLSGFKAGKPGSKSGEVGPQLCIMPLVLNQSEKCIDRRVWFSQTSTSATLLW